MSRAVGTRRTRFAGTLLAAAIVGILGGLPALALAADEIHWTFMGQTAVTFDWRGSETSIRYGTTTAYGQTVTAVTPSPLPFSSSGPFKEARITGLQENAVYHYSIGTGADHTFRTPPTRGTSGFTIYTQGDIGDNSDWPTMGTVQGMIAAGNPDWVLVVGDLTYGNSVGQGAVDRHFNDVQVWSLNAGYMPAWGNHEYDSSGDDLRNYKGRFDLPNPKTSPDAPSAGCCGEDWWWFDYGNVRFIAYPEYYSGSAWDDWGSKVGAIMAAAQSDPAISFIVTAGHQPAYSTGYHPGESILADMMDQLGRTYSKYVLNVNGHSHNYERSKPQGGVTHITVGVGGADLEVVGSSCKWQQCPPPSWVAYRAMHHAAIKLHFTSTSIDGTVYCGPSAGSDNDISCNQGTVIDTFVIGTSPVADTVPPAPVTDIR
jgi:hypothetical protein